MHPKNRPTRLYTLLLTMCLQQLSYQTRQWPRHVVMLAALVLSTMWTGVGQVLGQALGQALEQAQAPGLLRRQLVVLMPLPQRHRGRQAARQ